MIVHHEYIKRKSGKAVLELTEDCSKTDCNLRILNPIMINRLETDVHNLQYISE
jgi:hypothetical protein